MLTDGTLQHPPIVQASIDAIARISTELGPAMALTFDGVLTDADLAVTAEHGLWHLWLMGTRRISRTHTDSQAAT